MKIKEGAEEEAGLGGEGGRASCRAARRGSSHTLQATSLPLFQRDAGRGGRPAQGCLRGLRFGRAVAAGSGLLRCHSAAGSRNYIPENANLLTATSRVKGPVVFYIPKPMKLGRHRWAPGFTCHCNHCPGALTNIHNKRVKGSLKVH